MTLPEDEKNNSSVDFEVNDGENEGTPDSKKTVNIDMNGFADKIMQMIPMFLPLYQRYMDKKNEEKIVFDAKLSKGGRLTIPEATREKFELKEGEVISLKVTWRKDKKPLGSPWCNGVHLTGDLNTSGTADENYFEVDFEEEKKEEPKNTKKKKK